jgi:hypothetical protein
MKHQLNVALQADGSVKIGNCKHCVTKRQRPPVGTPKDYVDWDEEQLVDVASQLREQLAAFGIQVDGMTFVPKTDLPRAQS